MKEAAAREFEEETGLKIEQLELQGIYDEIDRDPDGRQNVDHCFAGVVAGDEIEGGMEVDEVRWFELEELPEQLAFDHRRMVDNYMDGLVSVEILED